MPVFFRGFRRLNTVFLEITFYSLPRGGFAFEVAFNGFLLGREPLGALDVFTPGYGFTGLYVFIAARFVALSVSVKRSVEIFVRH